MLLPAEMRGGVTPATEAAEEEAEERTDAPAPVTEALMPVR